MSDSARLLPGDWVQVRSAAEIRQTLDANGCLAQMPFMPEMLSYCGKSFRVFKRADKTCDSIQWTGLRQLENTVHLSGLRCDGTGHGGCQAGCLFYWNEAWLKKVDGPVSTGSGKTALCETALGEDQDANGATDPSVQAFLAAQTIKEQRHDGPIYRCQVTEVLAASKPLPWYSPQQYWRDFRENGVGIGTIVVGLTLSIANKCLKKLRLPTYPNVCGKLTKTPTENLGLKPGDWVRVKSHAEILKTLDKTGRNRGLTFDPEMTVYCGQRLPVLRVVERIIQEDSGRMVTLPGRCIILANGVCTAVYHRFCPRSTYAYWREIWLEPEK